MTACLQLELLIWFQAGPTRNDAQTGLRSGIPNLILADACSYVVVDHFPDLGCHLHALLGNDAIDELGVCVVNLVLMRQ